MSDVDQTAPESVGAVILGAGYGRRFGTDKRFAEIDGQPVAKITCSKYCAVFDHVRVVVRPDDDRLQQQLAALDLETVVAEQAHLGMGHSLAAGFTNLTWAWAFVALMDMPYIATHTLQTLKAKALSAPEGKIVVPALDAEFLATTNEASLKLDQKTCHPMAWHAAYFARIAQSKGDEGARRLLRANRSHIIRVAVADSGIIQDIDHPDDLR